MADVSKLATPPAPKNGGGDPAESGAGRAPADAGARTIDEGARQAEAVADKTAEASRAATKANTQILRTQIETGQQAVHSTLEAGMRGFEGVTQHWARAFGMATPNSDAAEQSAQNIQAVAQASSALAKGAQDASRAWFDLTQKALRANLQAFGQFANCRTVQEVVNVQSNLLRDNLQQAIESGGIIAQASTEAIGEATRAMQAQRGS